jgi:hypothetical protein
MRLLAPTLLLLAGCASPLPAPAIERARDFQLRRYVAAARCCDDHQGRCPTSIEGAYAGAAAGAHGTVARP